MRRVARGELGRDARHALPLRPHDDGRSGAGKRRAERAARQVGADLAEVRRVLRAIGLVQAVVERGGEEARVVAASAAPSSAARTTLKTASRAAPSSGSAPRDAAVFTRVSGHDRDRLRRQVVRDALDVTVVREADAAGERRREVVGMALELEPGSEQLLDVGSAPAAVAPATRPSATTAALEPRPRSRGIRSMKSNERPAGDA